MNRHQARIAYPLPDVPAGIFFDRAANPELLQTANKERRNFVSCGLPKTPRPADHPTSTRRTPAATPTTRTTRSPAAGSRPRSCRRITRQPPGEYRQRLRRSGSRPGTRWSTPGGDRHDLADSRPGARWNHPGRGSPGRPALCRPPARPGSPRPPEGHDHPGSDPHGRQPAGPRRRRPAAGPRAKKRTTRTGTATRTTRSPAAGSRPGRATWVHPQKRLFRQQGHNRGTRQKKPLSKKLLSGCFYWHARRDLNPRPTA